MYSIVFLIDMVDGSSLIEMEGAGGPSVFSPHGEGDEANETWSFKGLS